MTEDELQTLDLQLRQIADEAGLGWVTAEVDEWIAEEPASELESPPRYRAFGRRDRIGRAGDYGPLGVKGWTAPRQAVTITGRSTRERVVILIDALSRALTEPPAVQRAMVTNLQAPTELRMMPVDSVSFVPEEDWPAPYTVDARPESAIGGLETDAEPEARSAILLTQLRALVVQP